MVCTTTMVVVTAATDGGLLSPLRECAMRGANAQNGTIHKRMRNTPTRRRNGDRPADFVSSVDDSSRMQIPDSIKWAPGSCSRTPQWRRHPVAKSTRAPGADHGVPQRGEPGPGRRVEFPHSLKRGLRPRSDRVPISEPDSSATCLHVSVLTRTLRGSAKGPPAAPAGKGIDVVDGSHRIPKCQLVRRRHRLV